MKKVTSDILELIKTKSPDKLVILGDTLDEHDRIDMTAQCMVVNFLEHCSTIIETYVLIGNHDRRDQNEFMTEIHPFTALQKWPNLHIVWTTQQFDDMLFVPYVPPGRFFEALEGFDYKKARVVFSHQELKGCLFYGDVGSKVEEEWSKDWGTLINGHIHGYHKVLDNFINVGMPYQQGYSDSSDKAVMMLTIDDKREITYKRYKLKSLKPLITVETSVKKVSEVLDTEADNIIVSGSKAEITSFKKSIEYENLINDGIRVVCKEKYKFTPSTAALVPFEEELYERIKHDKKQVKAYNSVFIK